MEAERAASRSGALTHKEMRYGDWAQRSARKIRPGSFAHAQGHGWHYRLNFAEDEMHHSSVSAEWTHPFKNSPISSKNRCIAESCSNKM